MTSTALPTVLFLHPSDELYGADRQLLALVRASRGICRPLVLLPDDADFDGGLSSELRTVGIDFQHGPLPVLRRRYGSPLAMLRWLPRALAGWWWVLRVARSARVRAMVSNSTAIPVGPSISRLMGIPHLWFVREFIESPGWFRGLVRLDARIARGHVYTVSDAVGAWLDPIAGRGPSTLHDGVEPGDEPEALPERPLALYSGRINEWKGWDVFVEAAGRAHERVPEARFRLIGGTVAGAETDGGAVQAAIEAVDPGGEWLEWSGQQSSSLPAMRDAWLVAVPSTRPDPFPNVVLEGMAQGRAVVGSRAGGIPEMIIDGGTGRVVPPGDAAALADAMVEILGDRDTAERMGAAGRARLSDEFSMRRFEAAWSAILHEALEPRV